MIVITNNQLAVVSAVFDKLGNTTDEVSRWEFAVRICKFKPFVDALNEARKPSDGAKRFQDRLQGLAMKHGSVVEEVNGFRRYEIPEGTKGAFAREQEILRKEYASEFQEFVKHQENLRTLGNKEIELDIEPIKYEWCDNLINAKEVAFLMGLGLITASVQEDAKNVPNVMRKVGG
jgi:uncharacterized protein YnzC (UPF0291/DUF896 family)